MRKFVFSEVAGREPENLNLTSLLVFFWGFGQTFRNRAAVFYEKCLSGFYCNRFYFYSYFEVL